MVSCDNMGVLHTFSKKSNRVPASNSNAVIRRVLREGNRRGHNKYSLEHNKRHQDITARFEDLSLEAQLNVENNKMANEAVKVSMTRKLRDER